MFKVFAFSFETCDKTISSLIYQLINEALLLTVFQPDAISAHGHTLLVSDKHIPAFRFQLVSPGAGAVVWFSIYLFICICSCSSRVEREWCIGLLLWCLSSQKVAAIHLSSCWWLLLSSAPYVHKSTELLWHKTPTSHQTCGLPIDQTSVL